MARFTSNVSLLTAGPRSKKKRSSGISIVFDDKARAEYLASFRNKNKDRLKLRQERQKELAKIEKTTKRREKRRQIKEALSKYVAEVESEANFAVDSALDPSAECQTTEYHDTVGKTTVIIEPLQ